MFYIANFIAGFIVMVFGLITRFLKAADLIAGYNTLPKEEKAKYDEEKLTKFVGNMLIISSAILIIFGFVDLFVNMPVYIAGISWALFIGIILYGVIYMNTGNRFKK